MRERERMFDNRGDGRELREKIDSNFFLDFFHIFVLNDIESNSFR